MKKLFSIVPIALTVAFGVAVGAALPASPAMAQNGGAEVRSKIMLAGTRINGVVSKGTAEARSSSTFKSLKVQAEGVNLADGTVLTVSINGAPVATLTLVTRRGEVEISTKNRQAVPAIKAGDAVAVTDPTGMTVLSGKF